MRQFITMVEKLNEDGWFPEYQGCLCHLDLAPRNILYRPEPNEAGHIIVGVLDWESAVLAPSFMRCVPLLRLWAWNDGENKDEWLASDVSPTEEAREIKGIFEAAAGPGYLQYANSGGY